MEYLIITTLFFYNSTQMNVWEEHNIYKQYQLIIKFTLSNHSHYFPLSPILLFALLYLSTLSIPWLEARP